MSRLRICLALTLLAVLSVTLIPAATSARTGKPLIKGEEVGYFGTALLAHRLSVFVYSSSQPGAGTHVTVCVKGICKTARGHKARTAWYSASFKTSPLLMGAPVTYSVAVSNSAGRAKAKVTQGLLCMHNDGSTPQQS